MGGSVLVTASDEFPGPGVHRWIGTIQAEYSHAKQLDLGVVYLSTTSVDGNIP